jgi:hypothetical protein
MHLWLHSVAGFGFFVLSFVVLGILPARQLKAEVDRTALHSMQPLTASEAHGRVVYGREGCAFCHAEQVRVISADVVRFGAPTAPWETQYDYPHLWGTRRVGPDLSREHGLRTNDWHIAHLFDPRSTVPDSIMPPYPWLFNGSSAKPNQDGLDLVAYLRSLGRERELAGDSGNEQVDRGMAMEMSSGYSAHASRIPDHASTLEASTPMRLSSPGQVGSRPPRKHMEAASLSTIVPNAMALIETARA